MSNPASRDSDGSATRKVNIVIDIRDQVAEAIKAGSVAPLLPIVAELGQMLVSKRLELGTVLNFQEAIRQAKLLCIGETGREVLNSLLILETLVAGAVAVIEHPLDVQHLATAALHAPWRQLLLLLDVKATRVDKLAEILQVDKEEIFRQMRLMAELKLAVLQPSTHHPLEPMCSLTVLGHTIAQRVKPAQRGIVVARR